MPHPLTGHFSVSASAMRIRHYRYVEERMLRMLGGWIALTPELSAKLLLGRHVWDCAQHADLWGRRLPELRAPAHESEPPGPAFARFLDTLETCEGYVQTPERLAGVYRVLKPHLLAVYEAHLAVTNTVYEPPTRRILERCIEEERRHVGAGTALLGHHVTTDAGRSRVADWEGSLRRQLADSGGLAGDGSALGVEPVPLSVESDDLARQLVAWQQPLARWPIPSALESALAAYRAAMPAHDLSILGLARAAGTEVSVIGCARIGRYWVVKLRCAVEGGAAVLVTRWCDDAGAWRVVETEVMSRHGVLAA